MNGNSWGAIFSFALSREKVLDRAWYLFKGLAFAPWLLRGASGQKKGDDSAAAAIGEAGDDIYPLF